MIAARLALSTLFLVQVEEFSQHSTLKALQQKSMENALLCSSNIDDGWWFYAMTEHIRQDDCCTWAGMECTDGILTTFCLMWNHKRIRFFAQIHFLPPTIQYLHIKAARMDRLALRELPRDLLCAFIESAQVVGRLPSEAGVINLADLPEKLEEGYIYVRPQLWGTVSLLHVPQTLRYFFLSNSKSIKSVVVRNAGIPDGLEKLNVHRSDAKKPAIHCVDAENPDKRVKAMRLTSTPDIEWSDFLYFAKTGSIIDQLASEMGLLL